MAGTQGHDYGWGLIGGLSLHMSHSGALEVLAKRCCEHMKLSKVLWRLGKH